MIKPIIVRVNYKRSPNVLTAFAGREAEICRGFGTPVLSKIAFLQLCEDWYDTMRDVEKAELVDEKARSKFFPKAKEKK